MLILSRKAGESIVIDGRIRVKIVRIEGDIVKVGVEAPTDLQVHRQEVFEELQRSNQQSTANHHAPMPKQPVSKSAPPRASAAS
jgi:carbon storage regulator